MWSNIMYDIEKRKYHKTRKPIQLDLKQQLIKIEHTTINEDDKDE